MDAGIVSGFPHWAPRCAALCAVVGLLADRVTSEAGPPGDKLGGVPGIRGLGVTLGSSRHQPFYLGHLAKPPAAVVASEMGTLAARALLSGWEESVSGKGLRPGVGRPLGEAPGPG